METWMIVFVLKWGLFFFLPIAFGRWIIISNWKHTETTFEESKLIYDFFQEKDQQQKDIDLIKISEMIDKNVRKYNYKQWYLR